MVKSQIINILSTKIIVLDAFSLLLFQNRAII